MGVKLCELFIIRLQEDWVLQIRSHIHRCLIFVYTISALSRLEWASPVRASNRGTILFLLTCLLCLFSLTLFTRSCLIPRVGIISSALSMVLTISSGFVVMRFELGVIENVIAIA